MLNLGSGPVDSQPASETDPVTPLRGFLLTVGTVAALAVPLQAQDTYSLSGRVVEEGTSNGIPGATVEIENREILGTGSTGPDGGFLFEGIEPGGYTVRVAALGYSPVSLYVVADEDTALEISLSVSPIPLDSLAVDARSVDIGGRVVDERQVASRWMVDVLLSTTVPQEVERVEFLSAPADPDFVMMRVYTREFIRRMIASDVELRRPRFTQPSTGRADVDLRGDYRTFQPPPRILENRSDEPPAPLCG